MDGLLETIKHSLSCDDAVRKPAEETLLTMAPRKGYLAAMVQIASATEVAAPLRQSALVLGRKAVKLWWCPGDTAPPNDGHPLMDDAERDLVRQAVFLLLVDPTRLVSRAAMSFLAQIIRVDEAASEKQIIGGLVKMIQSDNKAEEQAGLRTLALFIDDVETAYLPMLMEMDIFGMVRNLFFNDSDVKVKTRAVKIFRSCVDMVSAVEEKRKETMAFLMDLLPQWMNAFLQVIQATDVTATSNCGLQIAVVQAVSLLFRYWPKRLKKYVAAFLGTVANNLVVFFPIYEAGFVREDGVSATEDLNDSEGTIQSLDKYLQAMFDFIEECVRKSAYKSLVMDNIGAFVQVTVGYMQITVDQEENWAEDMNAYVSEDDVDAFAITMRASGAQLLDELSELSGDAVVRALGAAAATWYQRAAEAKARGDASWWKYREAVYKAIGGLGGVITEFIREARNMRLMITEKAKQAGKSDADAAQLAAEKVVELFSVGDFFANAVIPDLTENVDATPFLAGSALWCASMLGEEAPAEQAMLLFGAVAQALANSPSHVVRVSACRSIVAFQGLIKKHPELLEPHVKGILSGALELVSASRDETLDLVLMTIGAALRYDAKQAPEYCGVLLPRLLEVWMRSADDSMVMEHVNGLVGYLAATEGCLPEIKAQVLPAVASVLTAPADKAEIVPSIIDMLAVIVKHHPAPLSADLLQLIGPLVSVISRAAPDESAILQNGAQCLAAFVHSASTQLAETQIDGRPATDAILRVLEYYLRPETSESSLLSVGLLISQIVTQLREAVPPQSLAGIVRALVLRLHASKMPLIILRFITTFAHLFILDPAAMVEMLGSMDNVDGKGNSGLHIVMNAWVKWQLDVHGAYNRRLAIKALSSIFVLDAPVLHATTVEHKSLNTSGGISGVLTRMRSAKEGKKETVQVVPVHFKIFDILVHEMNYALEMEERRLKRAEKLGAAAEGDEDEDEDEEDDDDWEFGGEGGPFVSADDVWDNDIFGSLRDLEGSDDELDFEDNDEDFLVNPDDPLLKLDVASHAASIIMAFGAQDQDRFGKYFTLLEPKAKENATQALQHYQQQQQQQS